MKGGAGAVLHLCLMSSPYCLLFSAYCLLPTAYCLLPTPYCLLSTGVLIYRGQGAYLQLLNKVADDFFISCVQSDPCSLLTGKTLKKVKKKNGFEGYQKNLFQRIADEKPQPQLLLQYHNNAIL